MLEKQVTDEEMNMNAPKTGNQSKHQGAYQKISKDKEQIEQDVFDLVGSEIDKDQPVILDLEAIRVMSPGKYELDLVHLFKNEPLIFKLDEGKYMIDLVQSFEKFRKK